jgi:HlyD family type I secretion membrane fusion protein
MAKSPKPARNKYDLDLDLHDGAGIGGRVFVGSLSAFALVVALGGWAATSELSGAVIGQGQVKVDKDLRAIQHLDGGIVRSIAIKKGDHVMEGQLLFKLDDTQLQAELHIVKSQLVELLAKRQRLIAEREGSETIAPVIGNDDLAVNQSSVMLGELRLFNGNVQTRRSQRQQLTLGLQQLDEEINGLHAQAEANASELALVQTEAGKVQNLKKQGLIDGSRVYGNSRDLTKLKGQHGEIEAGIARAKARRNELELQLIAVEETARTDAQKQISDVEPRISELLQRKNAIAARLTRMDITSPIAGTVNDISVNTIGGVITPAQKLLTLVPENAKLQIEMRLQPTDIDQVYVGQAAKLRFSAFTARNTPELLGTIAFVSPATSTDQNSGQVYYVAQVEVNDAELAKLGGKKLVPGMPVETFVQTESRTALSYLVKPFADQFNRAFREQ